MRRSMRRPLQQAFMAAVVALAAVTAGACNSSDTTTTTPTTPTTTTPVTTTETFSAGLSVNGAATYTFIAAAAGVITAQLSTLDPSASPAIGLSLGTWNGTACQVVIANDTAALNSTVTGTVSAATSLCARVYDAGRLTAPLSYTITVIHP